VAQVGAGPLGPGPQRVSIRLGEGATKRRIRQVPCAQASVSNLQSQDSVGVGMAPWFPVRCPQLSPHCPVGRVASSMGRREPFDFMGNRHGSGLDCTLVEEHPMASKQAIDSFCRAVASRSWAVSRDPKDFSRQVFRAFVERAYDAVPVNPAGWQVDGRPAAGRVARSSPRGGGPADDPPRPRPARWSGECAEAGVKRVWMHRGGGAGAGEPDAVAFCRERGSRSWTASAPSCFLAGRRAGFHGRAPASSGASAAPPS